MVNGGGEGARGVIEHFSEGLCMVCRYGPQEAYATERVSCQEEGVRPVSSIVTTTAYVGAMQAAMALCLLAAQRGHGNEVPHARDCPTAVCRLGTAAGCPGWKAIVGVTCDGFRGSRRT